MSTFLAPFDVAARDRPDHPAIIFNDREISHGQLQRRVAVAQDWLASLGVQHGNRVAWLGANDPAFLVTFFACARHGAIFVPLNTRLTEPELAFQLGHCTPTVAIAGDGFRATLDAVAPADCRVTTFDPNPLQAGQPTTTNATPGDDTDALIVYTSGTTGRPKGAVHTHGSLAATVDNGVDAHTLDEHDIALAFLPLFHVGGLTIQTLPALAAGATVVLLSTFTPGAVYEAADRHGPTVGLVVPATMAALIEHPSWPGSLQGLRGVTAGSSIVPHHLLEAFNSAGIPAGQVYGSTETGPTATVLRFHEAHHVGAVGRAAANSEFRLERNEVQVRGPHLFRGYWNDPGATEAAFIDGWYRMGDVGHIAHDTMLYIDDRLNDMIISGGENIYPAEVEAALAGCPGVRELTVVGQSDEQWGETPVAVVVPEPDCAVSLADLRAYGEARLARYKLPTRLETVTELPRTALGKVQKFEVAQQLKRR